MANPIDDQSPSELSSTDGFRLPENFVRLFEIVPDPVWIDLHHRLVLANTAMVTMLRASSAADIVGKSPFDFIHPDYHALIRSRIRQALSTEKTMPVIQERLVRFDGSEVWVEVTAARFHLAGDEAIIAIFRDISHRKRAEEIQQFLVDLLDRTRSLDGEDEAVRQTVTRVGQFLGVCRCLYAELDAASDMVNVHRDYRKGVRSYAGARPRSAFLRGYAPTLYAGQPAVVDDTAADPGTAPYFDTEYQPYHCRAFLAVPVVREGRLQAVIAVHSGTPRAWKTEEVELLQAAAERTWLTLENIRLRQREHQIAVTLQRTLLQMPPEDAFPGITVRTEYEPALGEADVGGDFLDAFTVAKGKVALVVGDVSGKGLTAAVGTVETRYVLRAFLRDGMSPEKALARVNSILDKTELPDAIDRTVSFVCLAVVVVDTRTGAIVAGVAGGEPPLIVRADGRVDTVDVGGPPLGVAPRSSYTGATATLAKGDVLVMVTDGITEARRGAELFGLDGVIRAAPVCVAENSPDLAAKALLCSAREFAGSFRDDVAILLARLS
jgi:PAS domain S-box-containing protein